MSNGNDDWGNQPDGQWGNPAGGNQQGQGQGQQEGWGEQPASTPSPSPGFENPGVPPGGQAPGQMPGQAPGQTPGQQGGFAPGGPPQGDMVHQKKGGANKLETNDFVALAASWFIPGVGHLMLGQTTRGAVILLVNLFTCYGLGLMPFIALADAYFVALTSKYREVGDWEFFPDYNDHI